MTTETRTFVEPRDLLGVEFKCGHCGARLLYALPERPMRIVASCPNCNEAFYDANRMQDFQQFFALLTAMPRLTEGSKLEIRLQVRLSRSQPEASESGI